MREVFVELPALRAALRRAGRRHRRRAPDGHGWVEPVPRGPRPHPGAGPWPPRLHVLDTTDPAGHRSDRRDVPAGANAAPRVVQVGLHDRDAEPPGLGVGSGPPAPVGSRSSPIPGRSWRGWRATAGSRTCSRTGLTSAVATRPCRSSASSRGSSWAPTSAALLQGGLDALEHSSPDVDPARNPALQLAAALGGRRALRSRQGHLRPGPGAGDDGALGGAAHRRVARQGRHRRRARSWARRSATRRCTARTACSSPRCRSTPSKPPDTPPWWADRMRARTGSGTWS